MVRTALTSLIALALCVTLASADPGVRLDFLDGVPRVTLTGSWVGARYTVSRADRPQAVFTPLTQSDVLCTAECFALDHSAVTGGTYYYRFDVLDPSSGSLRSYGPFAVSIGAPAGAALSVRSWPQPARGAITLSVSIGEAIASAAEAARLPVEVSVHDLAGRRLRLLHSGPLGAARADIRWDGRDGSGRAAAAGIYLVRLTTPRGGVASRLTVVH